MEVIIFPVTQYCQAIESHSTAVILAGATDSESLTWPCLLFLPDLR
jgi:uncharacterized protein YcnI